MGTPVFPNLTIVVQRTHPAPARVAVRWNNAVRFSTHSNLPSNLRKPCQVIPGGRGIHRFLRLRRTDFRGPVQSICMLQQTPHTRKMNENRTMRRSRTQSKFRQKCTLHRRIHGVATVCTRIVPLLDSDDHLVEVQVWILVWAMFDTSV